ncbi:ATP-binding cassette domain-containing protein [bacterium]|nr:ATP-binding cassette domain-containing protein [candidate division CSSED10-310 bacterium]
MIRIINIWKSFGTQTVLKGIHLHVKEKESVVICGPGGSGKTLLMKICQGLVRPDSGEVYIKNRNILQMSEDELMELRLDIGMLFQNYALFDSMTVAENIGFYLANHTRMESEAIRQHVTENLKMVHLHGSENLMPSELSGGMQKRVGIARALVHRPSIMFYDSPTDGLDPVTTDAIIDRMSDIKNSLNVTSLIISNDMNTAFRLGDRIALLCDGVIRTIEPPETMRMSRDPYVYQFIRGLGEGPLYQSVSP